MLLSAQLKSDQSLGLRANFSLSHSLREILSSSRITRCILGQQPLVSCESVSGNYESLEKSPLDLTLLFEIRSNVVTQDMKITLVDHATVSEEATGS